MGGKLKKGWFASKFNKFRELSLASVLALVVIAVILLFIIVASFRQVSLSPMEAVEKHPFSVKVSPEMLYAGESSASVFAIPEASDVLLDLSSLNDEDRAFLKNSIKSQNINSVSFGEKSDSLVLKGVSGKMAFREGMALFAPAFDSYIVEFKAPSLLEKKKMLEQQQAAGIPPEQIPASVQQSIAQQVKSYESTVPSEQSTAISDMQARIAKGFTAEVIAAFTGRAVENSELKVEQTFSNVINGVLVSGVTSGDVARMKQSDYVKDVYPNKNVEATLMDSVPLIGADDASALGLNGEGITVGVIDTGVDYTHPDLGGCLGENCKVVGGYDFISNDDDPMDDHGHGTHVAATIAGEAQVSNETPKPAHNFEFYVSGSTISLNMIDAFSDSQGGSYNTSFGQIAGEANSSQFTEFGDLVTSDSDSIILNHNSGEESFVVSWDSGADFKSYLMEFDRVDGDTNDTTFNVERVGGLYSEMIIHGVGDTGDLDDMQFTINSMDNGVVNLSMVCFEGSCGFDRIYDAKGNWMNLPLASMLPAARLDFDINDINNNQIERHEFTFDENGSIKHDVIQVAIQGSEAEVSGLSGVAPRAKIYAYKVLDSSGSGSFATVISGIERAVDPNNDGDFSDHLDIISLSLGGPGDPDDPVSKSIDRAVDAGVVAVIAAGNSGPSSGTIGSPGTARNAITVAASDKNDSIAEFSSRGPVSWSNGTLMKPDITAPGVSICAAEYDSAWESRRCLDDQHVAISGTSMATPHISGVVALVKQRYPSLTAEQIKNLLMMTAKDLGLGQMDQGAGRVDVMAALESPIAVSGNLDFGMTNVNQAEFTKVLKIKNIGNSSADIALSAGQAVELTDNSALDVLSFDSSGFTLAAGEEKEVTARLVRPAGVDGVYSGKVAINAAGKSYSLPYSFSLMSKLTVEVEGEHYPNFLIFDNSMERSYGAWQGWDFDGNKMSFNLRAGSYTVYAMSDFVIPSYPRFYPESDEFILIDSIEVPSGAEVEKKFNLNDAKKFAMSTKSVDGEQLKLNEWTKGFAIYKNKLGFCRKYDLTSEAECEQNSEALLCEWVNNYCFDNSASITMGMYGFDVAGDKTIYLSNKPDNGFDTDILLKYMGITDPIETGGDIYAVASILHNVDDLTPQTIQQPSEQDYGIYEFSSEFAGEGPSYYASIWWMISSLENGAMAVHIPVAAPLTQTVYAYQSGGDSARYARNASFDGIAFLNYLRPADSISDFALGVSQTEQVAKSPFYSINPQPRERKTFTRGIDYKPGSMTVGSDFALRMNGPLLGGENSFITKADSAGACDLGSGQCTTAFVFEKPHYEVYGNGNLITRGDISWRDADRFTERLSPGSDYKANFSFVSYYPIFNKTVVTAEFSTKGNDSSPPSLDSLKVSPRFASGGFVALDIDASDNLGGTTINAYYRSRTESHEQTFYKKYVVAKATQLYHTTCDLGGLVGGSGYAGLARGSNDVNRSIAGTGVSSCIEVSYPQRMNISAIQATYKGVGSACGDSCSSPNCKTPSGLQIFVYQNSSWKRAVSLAVYRTTNTTVWPVNYTDVSYLRVCRSSSGASRDNILIQNLTIYEPHSEIVENWAPINLTYAAAVGGNISARGFFTPEEGAESVNMKIVLNDNAKNNQTYIITPVSLKEKRLEISLKQNKEILSPGSQVTFSGHISSGDWGVGNLMVRVYYNKQEIARKTSSPPYISWQDNQFIPGGDFSFDLDVPISYNPADNLSIVFGDTGVYAQKEYVISGFAQMLNRDIAVTKFEAPEIMYLGNITMNVTLANVGSVNSGGLVSLYAVKCYQSDSVCSEVGERILMESKLVYLDAGEVENVSFAVRLPEEALPNYPYSVKLIAHYEDSEDLNQDNNNRSIVTDKVFAEYDAAVASTVMDSYPVVENRTNGLTITISNNGIKTVSGVNYLIEYAEDVKEGEPEFIALGSGEIDSIRVNGQEEIAREIIFPESGQYILRVSVNASRDDVAINNVMEQKIEVQQAGSDGYVLVSSIPSFIVGEAAPFNVTVYNFGNEPAKNAKLDFYYSRDYCAPGNESECVPVLGGSQDISLNSNAGVVKSFAFNAPSQGYYRFNITLSADNEINMEDNSRIYYTYAQSPGPDVFLYRIAEEETFIEGKPSVLRFMVYNGGTEKASNANVSLYSVSYDDKYDEVRTLIGEQIIPEIASEDSVSVNFTFTPDKKGEMQLYAKVSAEGDVNPYNDEYYDYLAVKSNGLDGAIRGIQYYDWLTLGKPAKGAVRVENAGNESITDATVSVFVDGALVESRLVNLSSYGTAYEVIPFTFTPEKTGMINISAVLSVPGDIDESDNYQELVDTVYSIKSVELTITDSNDENVMRMISGYGEGILSSNRTVTIKLIEGQEWLSIASFERNESIDGFDSSILEYSMLGLEGMNMQPSESIISEYYSSLVDNEVVYYMVSANRLSFNAPDIGFGTYARNAYLGTLGLNGSVIEDYNMFGCTSFDFASKTCSSGWVELNNTQYYSYSSGSAFEAKNAAGFEAFAISESSRLSHTSTNLNAIDGNSAMDPMFERKPYGRIQIHGPLDITRLKGDSDLLNAGVKINYGNIGVDSVMLPEFKNTPAELTFWGIKLKDPLVTYSGSICPPEICTGVSYDENSSTLKVNVTGFSVFGVIEGSYCGDGSCSGAEDCSSCVADCGECAAAGEEEVDVEHGGSVSCTPQWSCDWGPCVNGLQSKICTKTNKCRFNTNKPADESKPCIIPSVCVDNDGDGYGDGKDCLGIDLNDNDPGVTDVAPAPPAPPAPEKKGMGIWLWIIMIIVLIAVIAALFFMIRKLMLGRAPKAEAPAAPAPAPTAAKADDMIEKAKAFVAECRKRGYEDDEIHPMLKKKGWTDDEIYSLLR
jgi:subtilisin family serine protease